MSLLSAFRGDTYRTCTPEAIGFCRHRASRQAGTAARVLHDPVGARMRVFWPAAMAGQPCRCAAVGPPRAWRNHSRTGGKNRSRTLVWIGELLIRVFLESISPSRV